MKTRFGIALLALTLTASVATADIPSAGLYLGVRGGGNLVLDDWDLSPVGNGGVGPTTGALIGGHLGFQFNPWIALELGADYLPTKDSKTDESAGVLSYRGSLLFSLMKGNWVPFITLGGGAYQALSGSLADDTDFHIHWGLGLRGMLADWLALRIDARHMTTDGYDGGGGNIANNVEITAGLDIYLWRESHVPPVVDTDHDGIPDKQDACPKVPGHKTAAGCPDRDGDHISDDTDSCPDIPGPAKTQGCPDKDGDGMIDSKDRCPNTPGPVAMRGCPDRDGDGLIDAKDRCPDKHGPKSMRGCPDSDGDNIADIDDNCPTVAGIPEEQGCMPKEVAEKFSGALEGIYFKTASAKIRKKSGPVLNAAIAILKKYPSVHVRIEGHTDSRGKDTKNLKLSQARADSVKAYLVSKGIAADRMKAIGFGETKPIADNKKKKGRSKNRRIEFQVIR